ncbi:MAG: outer membrane protein assembly factor BamC [Ferrovum sp.]|nr:outer membrane protein assembly factor BamC [Ferrovum sp.]
MAGCTTTTNLLQSKKVDYKAQAEASPPLDVPPDLTPVQTDERFAIPERDKNKGTTYSQYSKDQGTTTTTVVAGTGGVLPKLGNGVSIERDGAQRWLVVKATPEQVWPVLKEFWTSNGFELKVDNPQLGLMETDWTENRATIPQDFLKRVLSTVVNNLFSSPLRDKYRTRVERGTVSGTTEIFITHRGMEEVVSKDYTGTSWQMRPEDPEMENEYLKKLAVRFGTTPEQATTLVASTTPAAGAQPAAPAVQSNALATLVKQPDGDTVLSLNEPFDRAWRRVGLALDRSGFTVEDRDRAAGVYFVRYTDSDAPLKSKKKESFLSSLQFWKSEDKSKDTQTYRITITTISGKGSKVDVRDKAENQINPDTANKMLSLIYEQLH